MDCRTARLVFLLGLTGIGKLIYLSGPPSRWMLYTKSIAQFYFNYSLLVLNGFGLQNALERNPVDMGHFFGRCHSAATTCALIVRDELAANDFLRHSPDSHCVLISYAVLTLLKVWALPMV